MTTWFIRLGSTRPTPERGLYQALANAHSLIMVGYGIQKDIITYSYPKMKTYFDGKKGPKDKPDTIKEFARQTYAFINDIKDKHIVICGFSSHGRNLLRYRVGEVIGGAKTVKGSLHPKTFNAFVRNYSNPSQDPIDNKPSREVKWMTEELNLGDFSNELQKELRKAMPGTVNRLKF